MSYKRYSYWSFTDWLYLLIIAITIIGFGSLIAIYFLGVAISYENPEVIDITVERLEVKRNGDSDRYLVFAYNHTDDKKEVFENTDMLFVGKWDSSDVQHELAEGERFTVLVRGRRLQFFSWYRNIIEIVE